MNRVQFSLSIFLLLLPILVTPGFAQSTYVINIVEGAGNSNNQIFWHIPSSTNLQGELVITQGDSIRWENNDTVEHTITSGSPSTGFDGFFDSGAFGPGYSVTIEFPDVGTYPYFCSIHPWMIGKIIVAEPYAGREQVIQNVGAEFDDSGNGFEIKYTLEGTLSDTVQINQEQKSITFFYDPQESKEDILIIELPPDLIDGIKYTQVDGEKEGDAIREQIEGTTTMYVPLWPSSKEITFIGSEVISSRSSAGGGCLIATATYGSELSPQVQSLREIRDNKLLQTKSGSEFIENFNEFYYYFSPTVADYQRENWFFNETIKLAITPMITSLSILNHVSMDSEAEVLGYGISLILLNLGMYIGIPAAVIISIKKKF